MSSLAAAFDLSQTSVLRLCEGPLTSLQRPQSTELLIEG